ncbi:hypothetical protein PPERSA_11401 [Pseudocohnilembus persalinus]|uniref:Tubulin--tyrosine ligase-like protein 9 n=1 Tax=Pseudocohnilembus persalinus TaxID=266149 RepID=A0A0V0QQP3_PSEPJ|nr:hypothetical protein PPERSA_11401 [Pseudocohnilembus persalinus]|eukprot:KRX04277.1 hypothetical protein PPERSA_11401 [Pseudocohnilembus persalinus]
MQKLFLSLLVLFLILQCCCCYKKKAFVYQMNKKMNERISNYFLNSDEWELLDNSDREKINMKYADLIWKAKLKEYVLQPHQWWNHSPHQWSLNNKGRLVSLLRKYSDKINNLIEYTEILPESYRVYLSRSYFSDEEKQLFSEKNRGKTWIVKPMGGRRGEGIYIVDDLDKFYEEVDNKKSNLYSQRHQSNQSDEDDEKKEATQLIVQRYIDNPFLINGKKFDIRCYLYVSSYEPFVSFYYPGYLRKSIYDYDKENYTNMLSHLVNVSLQKQDPNYQNEAKDSLWMMEQFKEYVLQQKNYTEEDYQNFEKNLLKVLTFISEAFVNYQENDPSRENQKRYQVFGADIAVDENLNPYILEVNIDPQLDNPHEQVTDLQLKMLEACQSFQGKVLDNQENLREFYQQIDPEYLKNQDSLQKNLILLYNSVTGYSYNYSILQERLQKILQQKIEEL